MPRAIRMPSSIQLLLSGARRPAADPVAPEVLRRRVLAGVRGEPPPRRPPPLAAAVVLAAIVAATVVLFGASDRHGRPQGQVYGRGGPHASLRHSGHRNELEVSSLAEPPIGEVYEIWLEQAGGPARPTDALFTVTHTGRATVEVPGSLHGVRQVVVTAEPLGGSSSPTGAPVLRVAVTDT